MLPNGNLVIRDIRTSDAGTYKCVASNKHGEAESETELTVLCEYITRILSDLPYYP